jgi:glycosyltransferase involved in cell wall biosynthesis
MYGPFLTILTPTFNRAHTLTNCFASLISQTNHNFQWIIIDDGSTDDTRALVNQFIKEADFSIIYEYKKNGGKHTALNVGIKRTDTELIIILDSDDVLTPNAVEVVFKEWNQFRSDKLCGMSFLKANLDYLVIGDCFPQDYLIASYIDVRINMGVSGDKAEVFVTNILKEFTFPEFEGERFLGEGIVWARMARKYTMVHINKIIYMAEYLDDGLSSSVIQRSISSPLGGMALSKELLNSNVSLFFKMKKIILYCSYGLFGNKSIKFMWNDCGHKILFCMALPIGYIVYIKRKITNGCLKTSLP